MNIFTPEVKKKTRKSWKWLSEDDVYEIYRLKDEGMSVPDIAIVTGRAPSTVYKKLQER